MARIETFRLSIKPLKQSPRRVYVCLPNDYDTSNQVYPVLYMFDGHNLFDDKTATYGKCWGLKKYIEENDIPLVVIGEDCNHTGDMRLFEYCPFPSEGRNWFPEGEVTGKITAEWFAKTLKPYCEKKYRICKDRDHVGIGGSSMGGLMSMYCIAAYNNVYSKAACLSATTDITLLQLLETICSSRISRNTKVYMDFGSREVRTGQQYACMMERMLEINHAFQEKNCSTYPWTIPGGTHSEASWEKMVPRFLEYLYPECYRKKGVKR